MDKHKLKQILIEELVRVCERLKKSGADLSKIKFVKEGAK